MENINTLLETLHLEKNITLEDIPNVDLYVDQVVQLFENTYTDTTRTDDEKVLTKTMINNYAKGKLFIPIKNKKYSKEHMILISLIYQLKGALSINDIKSSLEHINESLLSDDSFELNTLYKDYLTLTENNVESFKQDVNNRVSEVSEISSLEDPKLEKFLLLTSFVSMSNMYRRLAEKLIDDLKES
ncbi:cytoplasmic protein [Bacillus anthracis]|nr:cytoplasmic protein [Bacillus cereus]PFC88813.1 cytoplasmic protein [Bacillus anthracis]PFE28783.1 cytoplasmic protein [Bacillus anthracis]PFF09248.1 cytoplasmic protein [Bacillus cereus]